MRRRIAVSWIAFVATLTLAGSAFASPNAVKHADWLADKGIVQGYEHGEVALDRNVSLAEAIAFIARAKGVAVDRQPGGWSSGYLHWANAQGAITKSELKIGNKIPNSAESQRMAGKFGLKITLPASGK